MVPSDLRGLHGKQPRAKRHYRWNRERLVSSHGYTKVRVGRAHPLADPNGYAYEHLLVWVSAGRERPRRGEVLRFRNDDKSDSRIENLLLVARGEHSRMNNAQRLRDDLGRLMSKANTRLVRSGAAFVRTVRMVKR